MDDQLLISACTFGAVAMFAYFLAQRTGKSDGSKLRDRLTSSGSGSTVSGSGLGSGGEAAVPAQRAGFRPMLEKFGEAAAQPFMPKSREKQSGLRKKLGQAGIYSPSAIRTLIGFKFILLIAGVGLGWVLGTMTGFDVLGGALGGLLGYLAPVLWLRTRIASNQKALTYGLADALDLMVVCVESGLTVDAAMQRVGQELALAHPALSRELGISHMETRVGLTRSESLRNLGVRTDNTALRSLASMLIQADRFGTSIAGALRVHSETLRLNRQHAAEEQAAKASVKMTFPLVLFIFPATFLVLAGPTIIGLMNSEIMK